MTYITKEDIIALGLSNDSRYGDISNHPLIEATDIKGCVRLSVDLGDVSWYEELYDDAFVDLRFQLLKKYDSAIDIQKYMNDYAEAFKRDFLVRRSCMDLDGDEPNHHIPSNDLSKNPSLDTQKECIVSVTLDPKDPNPQETIKELAEANMISDKSVGFRWDLNTVPVIDGYLSLKEAWVNLNTLTSHVVDDNAAMVAGDPSYPISLREVQLVSIKTLIKLIEKYHSA